MDPYRTVIKSARASIASYFGSESSVLRADDGNWGNCSRPRTAFQAVEQIYSFEDNLARQQVKLAAGKVEKPPGRRHLRERKRYERVYEELRSASPKKPVVASHDVRSPSRQSTGLSPVLRVSPERTESLRSHRSSMLHGLMDVCTQASDSTHSPSPPQYRRRRSHVSFTAKRLQQLDAPSDLLESLYSLRKESDLNLHRDAVKMKLEEVTNADPAAGQIKLMLVRHAVHRRNSRMSGVE